MNAVTEWYWTLTLEQQIGIHIIFGVLVVFSGIYLILGLEALLNRRRGAQKPNSVPAGGGLIHRDEYVLPKEMIDALGMPAADPKSKGDQPS